MKIFKKYYVLDAEDLGGQRLVVGSMRIMRSAHIIIPLLSLLLAASVLANIIVPANEKAALKRAVEAKDEEYSVMEDSLRKQVDMAYTIAEECNLHAVIGRLTVSKSGSRRPDGNSVWEFIQSLNVWYPEYIMAQAIQETELGRTAKRGTNNMFGMKVPSVRETTALNVGSGEVYARYKDWKLGVCDRVLWELSVFKGVKPTREEYLDKISHYAEASEYRKKIENIAKRYR